MQSTKTGVFALLLTSHLLQMWNKLGSIIKCGYFCSR